VGGAHRNVHPVAVAERDADAGQRLEQRRVGDDAGAAPGELLARLLEYLDVPARAQEQVGGKQSAE
jgi:hypothetical protein